MKRIILTSLITVTASCATNRENLEREIMVLTQQLSQAQDETERNEIRRELDALKRQFQLPTQSSAVNTSRNRNLTRDTYYYRGPAVDHTANTPLLNYSFERNYSENPNLVEGAPVQAINHPQAYVNEVPFQAREMFRNPHTNPTGVAPFRSHNPYGSQYRPHQGGMMMPYGGGYPQRGYAYGQRPGFGFGMNPYQRRPFHGGVHNQVQFQNNATEKAAFDATQRFRHELQLDPMQTGADAMQFEVVEKSRLQNGQIQVVVKTTGGITGKGVGEERIYLYADNGTFMRRSDRRAVSQGNTVQIQPYRVSNQQKFQMDRWLAERGLNRYGDPIGTMYSGGNPMMNMQTGHMGDEQARYSLIVKKHPQIAQLFNLQPAR